MEVIKMKKTDFDNLFSGITGEDFQERILDIKNVLSAENEQYENVRLQLAEKDSEIAKLRDTNQRLFLRVTDGRQMNNDEGNNEPITLDSIINNIKGDY